ncbi:MAG TPA: carboxypeptidase-like regulatory domain-containing protein [Rhizobacter sp.]|nr:carboxypeptidase-like regulatory domain-containing protein [Rhizobacter sp.]
MPRLTIPLDASGIDGFDPKQQPVKVLLTSGGKPLASETVSLDGKGQGKLNLSVEGEPRGLRVIVGPHDASDDELLGLQTIGVDIPLRRWRGKAELALPPIRITAYYWFWWLRWCRTFVIRGRVLCPDGSPVPGAVVCAYDVDAWWWWWTKQQVGCDTTDATGAFTIRFRWCCGWWPWYWWSLRRWLVEPSLARIIHGALQREPRLVRLPIPEPTPDLSVLQHIAGDVPTLSATRLPAKRRVAQAAGMMMAPAVVSPGVAPGRSPVSAVEPSALESLRSRLLARLPNVPIPALPLWPWHPWQPWWDCTPDIVFRATQRCGGVEHVIVNESWFQARFNIPQVSDVTLTATDEACCVPRNDCTEGECLALAKVCSVDADEVGGNPGADPAPVGYAFPNVLSNGGDAPFAGVVNIRGTAQCMSGVDYYEIEFTANGGATWQPVPAEGLGGFAREYWDFALGTDVDVGFSAAVPISGHHVYETVEHYEATHTPADWGASKVWLGTNIDLVFPWVTDGVFSDGTYGLRVIGYDEAGGTLSNPRVMNVCDTQTEAQIVVTLDNQSTFAAPGPAGNPCGPGTTHGCTNEPNTDILDARIVRADGSSHVIGPCGNITLAAGDVLEVDFIAHDAQGHLAWYDLIATYGENLARDLIALGGGAAAISPLPGGAPPVPAATQVGPDYVTARSAPQNAAAPFWAGGAMRLSIAAAVAFPESCCYQLELRAYKRTIVNCQANHAHRNLSERSFQVTV